MLCTLGLLVSLAVVSDAQRGFSSGRDPYWDAGQGAGRFDVGGSFGDPSFAARGPDLYPSSADRFGPSSSFSSPDFFPQGPPTSRGFSSGGAGAGDPGFADPGYVDQFGRFSGERGGRFSSRMDPGFPGGAADFGAGAFDTAGSFSSRGSSIPGLEGPPPEEYLGARGGQNGYPVHGGYCAGERCADGGLAAGVGLGIGSGTAAAFEHRRRSGQNENVRMYEMFASGPGSTRGAPGGFGGMPSMGPPAPPSFGGAMPASMPGGMPGGMPGAIPGMAPMMPSRGGFMGGPPMTMGAPMMGRPMFRFR